MFGITRDIVGVRKLTVPGEENIATVGALKLWMAARYPALRQLTSMAVAVDSEYADDHQMLENKNEVALLPPVSGG